MYHVEGDVEQVHLRVGKQQYSEMMRLRQTFETLRKRAAAFSYWRIAGERPATVKVCDGCDGCANMWQYAVWLVQMKQYYVDLFKRKVAVRAKVGSPTYSSPPLSPAEDCALQVLEWRLRIPVVMAFRAIAQAELSALEEKLAQTLSATQSQTTSSNTGFFGALFGGATADVDSDAITLTEAERIELFNAMDAAAMAQKTRLPTDYERVCVAIRLEKSHLSILSGSQELVRASFDGIFELRQKLPEPDRTYTEVTVVTREVVLADHTGTASLQYEVLIDSRMQTSPGVRASSQVLDSSAHALRVHATLTPQGEANVVVLQVPRPQQIVYNARTIAAVKSVFCAHSSMTWTQLTETAVTAASGAAAVVSGAAAAVSGVAVDLAKAGTATEEWRFHADVQAPVLILPADCCDGR